MAMAINEEKMEFLSTNSIVEVRSKKSGLEGAWYVAKILKSYSNPKGKFMVEFQNDSNQQLKEIVDVSLIRPLPPPPPPADQSYNPGDVVDALCGNGWWKGVVSKVEILEEDKRRYRVVFENPPQQFDFRSEKLRFHLVWSDDGIWVRPPNQEVPNAEDCEKQPAHVDNVNPSKLVPETEETLLNHSEKSGHENSVICLKENHSKVAPETEETLLNHAEKFRHENSVISLKENHSKVVPETEGTLLNHAEKFRHENSVTSLTPSMLMDSTEQVTDSTLAKCSMHNSGADLPLNKGKNSSPSQQESEPEHRMVESSKKTERQLNAQVTGQKIVATGVMVETTSAVPLSHQTGDQQEEEAEVLEKEKSKSRRGTVFFEIPPDKFDLCSLNPRFHTVWSDGRWVRPPKQDIPDTADCEKQSAHVNNTADHSKVVPETEETLPNHAKKFRKESSVISLTPLTLTQSAEKITDSTLAKCFTRDSGANLPLNKSSNHQEAGLENRKEESSKKREREPNAQIAGQKDAARGDQQEGSVENTNHASAVYVQADSELVKNQELPFTKSSSIWNYIDSLEVFQFLPQKPHYRPSLKHNEEIREESAICHMLIFATLVEKASKLEIEKPTSVFDSYLEALADLEMLGFDVKAVVDGIAELLSFKRRQELLENHLEEFHKKIAEWDGERAKLEEEEEINEIDKMISELEERRAKEMSQNVKEESKRKVLQFNASTIKDDLLFLKKKFKVNAAALGRIPNEKQ